MTNEEIGKKVNKEWNWLELKAILSILPIMILIIGAIIYAIWFFSHL